MAPQPVYALWHGGASYALPWVPDDVEEFPTIRAAVGAFDRRTYHPYYPCVTTDAPEDGGPEMWLMFGRPDDYADPYPDRIVRFGPRGGVRLEAV